ncbi:MAG: cytochrome c3 family protein [Akkermansiaceae bacterium]
MVKISKKRIAIIVWLLFTVAIAGWCYYVFYKAEDKTFLLPGVTTDAHHQIEMECSACHTQEESDNIFTSSGVPNSACMDCHGEALTNFSDSHPVAKFKNPENAIFLEHIDAMTCIACHGEHNQKVTGEMSVTVPKDYCAHCHEVTLENIESHKNLPYDTCATAGCHNYHDNMALSPSYLRKRYGQPDVLDAPEVPAVSAIARWLEDGNKVRSALSLDAANAPADKLKDTQVNTDWSHSAHARAGVNCSDCHNDAKTNQWIESPNHQQCSTCHDAEVSDFKKGKHGMRLAFDHLSPLNVDMARLPMKEGAAHRTMDCNACHSSHSYDRKFAAQEACIQCHNDSHTQQYENSKHYDLWKKELAGTANPGTGVSCATCHMPREKIDNRMRVNHDQTANLTPNEKMLKNVCTTCHGLQFSMNSMADRELINKNFIGSPTFHHEGIDWVVESSIERGDEDVIKMKSYLESLEKEGTEDK